MRKPYKTPWSSGLLLRPLWGFVGAVSVAPSTYRAYRRERLMKAIEAVTAKRIHTPDLGGEATTEIVTEAVCDAL